LLLFVVDPNKTLKIKIMNLKNRVLLTLAFCSVATFTFAQSTAPTAPSSHLTKKGTVDKRYKSVTPAATTPAAATTTTPPTGAKLKKDGSVDKRYKSASSAVASTPSTTTAPPVLSKAKTAVPSAASTKVTKTADAVDGALHGPHGEQVLSGPRGGKYYINKNGNKTYLKK
jgi:colicin import membrane protein